MDRKKNEALIVYVSKVTLGAITGSICGYLNLSLLLGWIILIIGITTLICMFVFVLKFDLPPLYIALWYGTFSYFVIGITSWTLIYNLIYS